MAQMRMNPHPMRALAVLLVLAVVPAGLAIAGIAFARSTVVELEQELRSRLETRAQLRAVVEQSREALAAAPSENATALLDDFLSGTQDPIVVAELQNRLRALAISHNVELNSANALASRDNGNISYLALRIILRGQLRDIQSVLHAIETGSPLLFVDRIAMRVDNWPIKSADPNQDGAPALIIEMDIAGAKLPTAIASPSAPTGARAAPAKQRAAGGQADLMPGPVSKGGRGS
jgi:Type II secretion system (T2SS), protein M subtype b